MRLEDSSRIAEIVTRLLMSRPIAWEILGNFGKNLGQDYSVPPVKVLSSIKCLAMFAILSSGKINCSEKD